MAERTILVTGGAGFIGSHTVLQLLKSGFRVTIIDNLDNSCAEAVDRVRELAGPTLSQKLEFNLVRFSFLNRLSFLVWVKLVDWGACLVAGRSEE